MVENDSGIDITSGAKSVVSATRRRAIMETLPGAKFTDSIREERAIVEDDEGSKVRHLYKRRPFE